jgi:3-hydroxyisobutyrate dehydrogenase
MAEAVGVIGLGIMGSGMAANLLKAGFEVHVWNRTRSKMDPLVRDGAIPCDSPAEVGSRAGIVLTCVSDTPDVESVLLGDAGLIHGLNAPGLVIDASTISPSATRDFANRLKDKGLHLIDAPVSGGSEGARNGTLSIMVGGDADQVERAMPVLRAIGKTITHIGPIGSGQLTKLVNQILVAGSMLSMGEALIFAKAGGLDLQKVLEAVTGGAAGSWTLTNRGPQVLKEDWRPGFSIDLQQKDLRLVLREAEELGVPVLATSVASTLYRSLQKDGLGGEGNHALIKAIAKLAGV